MTNKENWNNNRKTEYKQRKLKTYLENWPNNRKPHEQKNNY